MSQASRLSITQLFAYPFRIFFFSVAAWAVIAIPVWVAALNGDISPATGLPPLFWHGHEMLFGFFAVAMAGFLMTATCNWTQTNRTHGWPLFLMWAVWLAGRITMLYGGDGHLPYWFIAMVNLSFLPLVIFDVAKRVWLRQQARQYPLVVIITLLWLMQLGFLLTKGNMHFAAATLIMAMGVMLIIGGRITPNFSRNWLRFNQGPADQITVNPRLEKLILVSIFALFAVVVLGTFNAVNSLFFYKPLVALLAIAGAIISALRLALWKGWLVLKEPLLWILHLSLLWIPIALVLLAGHAIFPATFSPFAWMHAMAVGAMAGLILGVMTRVVLGHTGRAMKLPRFVVVTYVLIHLGAIARVAASFVPAHHMHLIICSAVLWTLAFAIFLARYIPFLMSARADGRPG